MAHSLIFSLPGTQVIRYGDEIGMGDDQSLPERMAVRTSMQWSTAENAGFSRAARRQLIRPVTRSGPFGYRQVNVEAQIYDANSLLNRMQRLIGARRSCPEIGRGDTVIVETDRPEVFAHACRWRGREMLAVHNFADRKLEVTLRHEARLSDLIGDQPYAPATGTVQLDGYGFRWFRVKPAG